MHFEADLSGEPPLDPELLTDSPGTECVAACYRCLMSYYNQTDHEVLDRRDGVARRILLRMAHATTRLPTIGEPHVADVPLSDLKSGDSAVVKWRERLHSLGLPSPDRQALPIDGAVIECVWREHYAAATIGPPDERTVRQLHDRGFELITFGDVAEWSDAFSKLAAALGRVL
jgi:hypothetical protein